VTLFFRWTVYSYRRRPVERVDGEIMMFRKIAVGTLVLLGVGATAVGVNTARFTPRDVAAAGDIELAPAPEIDITKAAANLGAAIRFQTVSHQNPAENKPEEWEKLHSWMASTYPKAHAAMAREILTGGTLVYKWQGTDTTAQPIILMAHQDVVPVTAGTEKDWKHQPFSGDIAGEAVWGRGAVDDKGSLVGLFEALEILASQGFEPKRTVWIVSGADEEVGGTGAKAAADLLATRNVKALFTLDEGSAIVSDAPIVNSKAIMIGVAEKGYATLKVTANAKGGHSSMPPEEIGTVNLAKAVVAIHQDQFPLELRAPVTEMVGALALVKGGAVKVAAANPWLFGGMIKKQFGASPSGSAMLHTTIAPTMLEGSPKENVLPQTATALINYRIAPWNSSSDVMARAKAAVGNLPVEFSWVKPPREPTAISSTKSQGWKFLRAAAEAEAPGAPVAPYLVVAGTDSRSFSIVSDDVYRFMPMTLSIKDTAMIHGTNEHMTVKNLEAMIRFYVRLVATAAG
jgi:carboxypeptidase PM20D1